jgi:hypothetical protein
MGNANGRVCRVSWAVLQDAGEADTIQIMDLFRKLVLPGVRNCGERISVPAMCRM